MTFWALLFKSYLAQEAFQTQKDRIRAQSSIILVSETLKSPERPIQAYDYIELSAETPVERTW